MPAALVDTGPLVALFVRNDPDHPLVTEFLRGFRDRLLNTWPVLTEVCHFLSPAVALRFLRTVESGVREILTLDAGDFATFRTPLGKPFKDLLSVKRTRR